MDRPKRTTDNCVRLFQRRFKRTEQGINIDSLEKATNAMEKRLSQNSKDFAQFYFTSKTKYSEIQKELKTDEAAVEIIRVRNYDQVFTDDCRYLVFIASKHKPEPHIIVINNGADLEGKHSKNYRLSMKNKLNDDQSYSQFWTPFEAALKEKKKIV